MVYVVSALLVLCLSATRLIFTIPDPQNTNGLDLLVCKAFNRMGIYKITKSKREFWLPVIEKVVLGLSDQQLLTGLAVLIAGFWTHCSISVYHFTLVNDLAWFSATVHLTTLSMLDGFFLENPVLRNWRVTLMVALAMLLVASTVMQGHYEWFDSWPYNAQCLFDDLIGNTGGGPRYWMCVNLALLYIYYPMSIITLYDRPRKFLIEWLWKKPMAARNEAIRHLQNKKSDVNSPTFLEGSMKRFSFTLLIFFVSTVSWMYFALMTLLSSSAFYLVGDIVWYAYGLWGLIEDRMIPPSQMNGNENAMSFGQNVPILLLSSIVLVFREAYDGSQLQSAFSQVDQMAANTYQISRKRCERTRIRAPTPPNAASCVPEIRRRYLRRHLILLR